MLDLREERSNGTEIATSSLRANHDPPAIQLQSQQGGTSTINPEERVVTLRGEWEMISMGTNANITPWKSPRELPEDQLDSHWNGTARQVKNQAKAIIIFMSYLTITSIDKAPKTR